MERPTLAALAREVRLQSSLQRLQPPNYRTIRARVGALDLKVSLQKREGSKKSREQVGTCFSSLGRCHAALKSRISERQQINSPPSAVPLVVDLRMSEASTYSGRPRRRGLLQLGFILVA
jgi:hypothetical protein